MQINVYSKLKNKHHTSITMAKDTLWIHSMDTWIHNLKRQFIVVIFVF